MPEIWTIAIVNGMPYPYEVSNFGRVRRTVAGMGSTVGRIRTPQPHSCGYLQMMLYAGNMRKNCYLHVLVAESFLGTIPDGHEVNHRDAIKQNNRLENLEYVTRQQNIQHSCQNRLSDRIKLTPFKVRLIRIFLKLGHKQSHIAKQFSVLPMTVHAIKTGKQWSHVK